MIFSFGLETMVIVLPVIASRYRNSLQNPPGLDHILMVNLQIKAQGRKWCDCWEILTCSVWLKFRWKYFVFGYWPTENFWNFFHRNCSFFRSSRQDIEQVLLLSQLVNCLPHIHCFVSSNSSWFLILRLATLTLGAFLLEFLDMHF